MSSASQTATDAPLSKAAKKRQKQNTWWFRWRFHLSGLLILIPVVLAPYYIEIMALFRGDNGLGAHVIGTKAVGPWEVTLAEQFEYGPTMNGPAGYMKLFNAAVCEACTKEVKAVYLRVGKPRSLRTAGSLGFGTPYRMMLHIPVPENTSPDADLWLTAEGWDGSVYHTTWSLAEASPATVEFLKNQQAQ